MTASAAMAAATIGFNYDVLSEDFAGTLFAAAERIKSRIRRQTADIIEIGRDLQTIKSEMDHGLFLKWVAAEFRWSARTAQNYMAAAEWAGEKYETVSFLPPTLVYKLAGKSTPEEIKTEVRADLAAGNPVDVKAIKSRIKSAKQPKPAPIEPTPASYIPPAAVLLPPVKTAVTEQETDVERVEAEQKAAAAEIVGILRQLPEPDFERLLSLLDTASLWLVQDMLKRGRA
jgi:hypothetical protein